MSDLALQYYNSVDKLDLNDLEILSQKITSLIFKKKAKEDDSVKEGLAYFNSIKGTVTREIDADKELSESLREKYEDIDWYEYYSGFNSKQGTVFWKCLKDHKFMCKKRKWRLYFLPFPFWHFFILRKDKTVEERKALILNLCKFFTVIPEDKNFYTAVCQNNEWNDLEDGLQMKCADFEKLDYIVTRDAGKGFNNSPVKIISAEKFLNV